MYKIIYGIPAMNIPKNCNLNSRNHIVDTEITDESEGIWCDFELDYEPDIDSYAFGFETCLGFEDKSGARNWIIYCLSCLTVYMEQHGYDINKELDLYEVFTTGINVNTKFKTIEDAYAFLKLMVFGFHGDGLYE